MSGNSNYPFAAITRPSKKKPRRRNRRRPESLLREESLQENSVEDQDPVATRTVEQVLLAKGNARKQAQKDLLRTSNYESETRRPIVCLAFVLPFLMFYEIGSILFGGEMLRSGIDQWIHAGLSQLGLGQLVVLPLVTVGILIAWHHRNEDHWQIRPRVLLGMALEACCLGMILFWAAKAISMAAFGTNEAAGESFEMSRQLAVAYVGSGIYEEVLFRIVLLIPVMYWANSLINHKKVSSVVAVIAVSLFFAALHYNVFNPGGGQFEITSFVFRFSASVIFCVLFLFRGFGIAVGTHVAYDLLTQF